MTAPRPEERRRLRRLLWFVAFYAFSLVAFTALVYVIRFVAKGG